MRMTNKERAYYEWRRANWKSMSIKTRLRHLGWEAWIFIGPVVTGFIYYMVRIVIKAVQAGMHP